MSDGNEHSCNLSDNASTNNAPSKPTLTEIAKGILVLTVLILVCVYAAGYFVNVIMAGIVSLMSAFSALDAAVTVALITGAISIVTVIGGSIVKLRIEYVQRRNEYLRERREKPYEKLVEIVYKINLRSKQAGGYGEDEMLEDISEFSRELTLWGSSNAVRSWGRWRTESASSKNPKEVLGKMEEILFQLRKDMGNGGGLRKGDLLRFFINDVDQALLN